MCRRDARGGKGPRRSKSAPRTGEHAPHVAPHPAPESAGAHRHPAHPISPARNVRKLAAFFAAFYLSASSPRPARSAAMEAQELKVKLPNWLSMPSESPHPRPPAFAASFHEPPRPKARLT